MAVPAISNKKHNKMNYNKLLLLLAVIGFTACHSEDYREIRKEVLSVHDSVMSDAETAVHQEMRFDTLLQRLDSLKRTGLVADTAAEKTEMEGLRQQLRLADHEMGEWMQAFQAEIGKKSNKEAADYFRAEKIKVQRMDSLYKKAISGSAAYLRKFDHP